MVDWFGIYQQPTLVILALLLIAVWELIWKGLGLWHSAKNRQKAWFIVRLIFNTIGLLPIIYLLWFKPKDKISSVNSAVPKKVKKNADTSTVVKIRSAKKSRKISKS